MTRVLVVGHSPLPWEDLTKSYGPGTRTWQFAQPLLEDGHDVTVLASRIPFVYPDDMDTVTSAEEKGCTIYRVEQSEFEVGGFTDRLMTELDPDCVVGATAYASYVASIYSGLRPLWVDVFGSLLAEAQAKAAVYYEDAYLEHFLRINRALLEMGDRFSTVSSRQKYELVGQLGVMGRLCADTLGYEFATSIPCAVQPIDFPPPTDPTGGAVGPEGFTVLWSGGFNTWTDVRTLFEGMELAMEICPRIHFVSTGGDIQGHDEKTYPEFERLVEGSSFRDHFHLKGWVKKSEAMSYYGAASVGINMDASHYEVMFGSRNRILEWALAGLPALSTNLCELTGELASEKLLFPIPVGDAEIMARRIVELEADRGSLDQVGSRLRAWVLERYSFRQTTSELRDWVADPAHAPDFAKRSQLRIGALEDARRAFTPPITPESSFVEKFRFYVRTEGLAPTLGRAVPFIKRKVR